MDNSSKSGEIAGLGSFGEATSSATPSSGSVPSSAVNPSSAPPKRDPARREAALLILFTLISVAAIAVMLVNLVDERQHEKRLLPETSFPGTTSSSSTTATTPTAGGSLIRQKNFAKALDKAVEAANRNAAVVTLRLDNVLLSVVTQSRSGGRVISVSQGLDVAASDTSGVQVDYAPPLADISTAAPQRAIRGIVAKSDNKPSDVDYLVYGANPVTDKTYWNIYLNNGQGHWSANGLGRNVKPMGGAS